MVHFATWLLSISEINYTQYIKKKKNNNCDELIISQRKLDFVLH